MVKKDQVDKETHPLLKRLIKMLGGRKLRKLEYRTTYEGTEVQAMDAMVLEFEGNSLLAFGNNLEITISEKGGDTVTLRMT